MGGWKISLFLYFNIYYYTLNYRIMKDIYKDRVTNNLESCITKTKVVHEMITGERPADPKQAGSYLQQIAKILEEIQDVVQRG